MGGEKEGLRGRAGIADADRVENRRHQEDEPAVAVEGLDEIEDRMGFECIEDAYGIPHVEPARDLHRFVPEPAERRGHRLELNENVELVRFRLLAHGIEQNGNAHDDLTRGGAPLHAPSAPSRNGECGR